MTKPLSPAVKQIQVTGRRAQLGTVTKQINSGKYSPEDVVILKERAAALRRMIASLLA